MEAVKVGVILLNWNGGEFTRPCIESLLRGQLRPWRILVFDNGSTDGSDSEIERLFPDVMVVRSRVNKGFAGANNDGATILLSEGADLIWILNNDTVVDPDCLRVLVEEYRRNARVGAITGKILYEQPKDLIWYAGGIWRQWSFTVAHRGARERDVGQYDSAEDVEFISGCCMLVPRGALEIIGLFDERYFIYCEDMEWCLRARKHDMRLRYVPRALLWHKVSASMRKNTLAAAGGRESPMSHYLNQRNRLFCIRQHARRPLQFAIAVIHSVLRSLYLAVALLLFRRWKKLTSLIRGLRDGFLMPVGK